MNKEEKRKQFWDSIEDDNGSWIKKATYRRENRAWLRKSQRIAVRILSVLDKKGMQQKELAEDMEVSPQQISKIVKGKENLTIKTISKLENVLGIQLMEVPIPQLEMAVERKDVQVSISDKKTATVKSRDNWAEKSVQMWSPSPTDRKVA